MEKIMEAGTANRRIIITGPESTGKTVLCEALAHTFGGIVEPEYARNYIENLAGNYTYEDVLHIADYQLMRYRKLCQEEQPVFLDTYLIITKVWMQWVFGKYPAWMDEEIRRTFGDLYLLCEPDLPWEADNVRENGGAARSQLFQEYEHEIQKAGAQVHRISGRDEMRTQQAVEAVEKYLNN